jgi:hypothetical protein
MQATPGSGADHSSVSDDGRRWLAVGTSADADSRRAGEQAARAAAGGDAKLLMVFCSALHDPKAVLAGIRSVAGTPPLIGCSTTAVIGPDGPGGGRGVVVAALGGPGFSVTTGISRDVPGRQREAGAEVAACAAGLADRPHQALVLFTDGLVVGQEEILAGAYGVVGASMPMVGGASCPDPSMDRTFQFHGDEVVANAIVGAAIASDGPFGVGLRHGWRKVGEPMIVTKSSHNEVYTLDDEPAVEAYLRRLGAPPEAFIDPAAFERFAERRPIGVRSRSGEVVRNVGSSSGLARGWLRSSGDVPEGGLIWPMEGDIGTVLQAADDACADAAAGLGGRSPLGLIAFDCETRARFLNAGGRREEVTRMAAHARPAPLAGLYTWGEIARTKGINAFHNQTLVVLAIG